MTKLQKDKASTRPLAKKEESGGESFEFCEVCNLNHDQGRRHRYIPKHSRTLANTLSRFQNKLSELQFFIQNPSFLRSEHAALNSIWCVFCALDISEIGGYFVCGNAIRHLASEAHLWNLKRYLWKHGGGIDQVDLFRVSEADLLKWEKGCEALKNVASSSSEGPIGPVLGPSKEMRIIGYATQPVMAPQLLPMLTRSRFLCHWACGEMCLLITWVAWKVWTYI